MNLSAWHAFATVAAMLAFFGICWWVLDPRNKQRFQQDANIVLKTDPVYQEKQADSQKRES